ncbi:MAG: protein ImuB [Solirubrobacteraceae bacterium]|jgi:protein ImuB|nr:protein ImuB [Solirubrobacteraceae bacterium]
MVVCVHFPRFELLLAAGGARALVGRALAIAPPSGSEQRLGEVSGAAEAYGVRRGMALGEALARCPDLALVPADPVGVEESWESLLRSLEAIGAAVESARAGLAYFETGPLCSLHGSDAAVIAAGQRAAGPSQGAAGAADRRASAHARTGAGPTRFCSLAAALAVRSRRPLVLDGSDALRWLSGRPIELLGYRAETEQLLEPLTRLGVRTLGELARLGRSALADRFGAAGVFAHRLACGEDTSLRPRLAQELMEETMSVGDASSGPAIERVLGVLVDRLLARSDRRGRTLRAVTLSARLLAGGGWRERVVFRQPLADRDRISLALSLRLLLLPAPAASLGLSVERFGPPAGEQRALLDEGHAARVARLREAVVQVRTVAGEGAAMRAVCVDPDSRVPERRVVLTPLPG